ncbi:metalloendoproteinase 4-MMP-like [Papaver somniferum]|uniref:metalloendoproteinase 4-MMP-like n=1 Tax=Papaver somniferum TaxID=3469 RepID=UPI000E6FABD2|nr:metalloendoproteinase 4-MMP-like [Papaver somniferum]
MMHYQQSFCLYVSFFFLLLITSVPARNTVLSENPNKNFTTLSDQDMPVRCGVDENHAQKLHITKHFSYINGRRHTWDRPILMLYYARSPNHTIDYIKASEIRAALKRAFSTWSSAINVNFTETQDYENANITIGFYYGDHGDGYPFDNTTVLAHATGPGRGAEFHFNAAFTFAVDFNSEKSDTAYDLESVAVHEIGHILGLDHSSVPEAIMWPHGFPRTIKVKLSLDDVYGAQLIYGSNPDFNLNSVMNRASKSFGLGEIITISVSLVVTALFSCL